MKTKKDKKYPLFDEETYKAKIKYLLGAREYRLKKYKKTKKLNHFPI